LNTAAIAAILENSRRLADMAGAAFKKQQQH